MNTLPQHLTLPRQALHTVADAAGLQLACHEGTLWLTLDDDPRDIILERGETFVVDEDQHRRALVYAIDAARVTIAQAQAPVAHVIQQAATTQQFSISQAHA